MFKKLRTIVFFPASFFFWFLFAYYTLDRSSGEPIPSIPAMIAFLILILIYLSIIFKSLSKSKVFVALINIIKNKIGIKLVKYISLFILIYVGYLIISLILYAIPYFGWEIVTGKTMPTSEIVDKVLVLLIFIASAITLKNKFLLKGMSFIFTEDKVKGVVSLPRYIFILTIISLGYFILTLVAYFAFDFSYAVMTNQEFIEPNHLFPLQLLTVGLLSLFTIKNNLRVDINSIKANKKF